jgi:hypothetical protein
MDNFKFKNLNLFRPDRSFRASFIIRHDKDTTPIDFGCSGNAVLTILLSKYGEFKLKKIKFLVSVHSVRASFIIFSMDIRHDKDIKLLSINRYKLIWMATLEYMKFTRKSGFRLLCEGS